MRFAVPIAVALLAACRGEPPTPAVPSGPTVQLTLDEGAPRTIAVRGTIALATLIGVPPTAWIEVHGDSTDDRGIELIAPATRYPGSELRLYLDQGQPALGVFPPVTPDMPAEVAAVARQPTASLTLLASVHVLTRRVVRAGLVVVAGGNELEVTSERLHEVTGVPRGTSRAQGWPLASVVELVASDHPVRTIRILGAGDPVVLEPEALRDPAQILVLKQNQRGEYVFRMWAPDGRSPTRELRRVTRIVLD